MLRAPGILVLSNLLEAVRHRLKEQARLLREERWAALLSSVAADVPDVVLLPSRAAGVLARRLEPMLRYEAVDPDTRRQSLLQRVDQETVCSRQPITHAQGRYYGLCRQPYWSAVPLSVARYSPLPPELGPSGIDARSIHAFRHGFPSPFVRWHHHDDFELHLIVASAGKIFVGDHVGSFFPGQLVLTGPLLPHNWISRTKPGAIVEMRDCVVQFRKDLVLSMATGAPELESLMPLLERARRGVEFHGAVCHDAEAWFEQMIGSEGPGQIGLLISFLERLSRERNYRTLSTTLLGLEHEGAPLKKLEFVSRHVREHHENPISLSAVAALVGMETSSFSHFFSRVTGDSFTRFVNSVRVAHACELLSLTDETVSDICFSAGFNNIANFNRRFREFKGMTPSEYRKQTQLGQRI